MPYSLDLETYPTNLGEDSMDFLWVTDVGLPIGQAVKLRLDARGGGKMNLVKHDFDKLWYKLYPTTKLMKSKSKQGRYVRVYV